MSKLTQLLFFKKLDLPTPPFIGLSWEEFENQIVPVGNLKFPVAVRSSFKEEDGDQKSFAGHFETRLQVEKHQLVDAIDAVFASYPEAKGNEVIIQEMINPEYSGVLFAFHEGVWKLELVQGLGENLVSGQQTPKVMLLPKFGPIDVPFSRIWKVWSGLKLLSKKENRALIKLSTYTQQLLRAMAPEHGLDIEFAITKGKLYLLQARPITTPEEAEEVLTSANHKEILPPTPSRFMTDLTQQSGSMLFDYYRSLDPTLPPRSFIKKSGEMPWINLSALLDLMVHWGLPTYLVGDSVGAKDVYQVRIRPYVMLTKLPVFFRALQQQRRGIQIVRQWINRKRQIVPERRTKRKKLWIEAPEMAFDQWLQGFQWIYIDLVTHMQRLTGAMSGPLYILQRLGWLGKLAAANKQKSTSMDYFQAISDLQTGKLDRTGFLEQFGHRGFYESDLGQPRFWEYSDADWMQLLPPSIGSERLEKEVKRKGVTAFTKWIARYLFRHVHAREHLRHEAMKFFWSYRKEFLEFSQQHFGVDFQFWQYSIAELDLLFKGDVQLAELKALEHPTPSGWDMDTFLSNASGRRLPISILSNVESLDKPNQGIGIYPGKVKGQVWRVHSANLSGLKKPDFDKTILVADALDPGWMPYFTQVDGVISYIGGLLSHASIVLRESGVPSITQLPVEFELQTGDWIEMDGSTGKIWMDEK